MPNYAPEMPVKLAASAFELFSRQGVARVSLDQVAAHAGVTKGSLYWHFASKNDVVLAACMHYYQQYHRRLNAEVAKVSDPLERLERALHLSVRTCLLDAENRVFTLEIFTRSLHDERVRDGWRQFYGSVREFFIGLVQAARFHGRIAPEDPELAVNTMLATMEGIKLRALYEPHICAPTEEEKIVAGLERILGKLRPGRASSARGGSPSGNVPTSMVKTRKPKKGTV
jgi:TetR/AcrR family transcriptional regulator, mexJK operon transcriptional repressor